MSRDKVGGYTIRGARKLYGSVLHIEPELLPIEVLHCRNMDFVLFLLL